MIRKYLFLVSERYAFPVMRPIQQEIIRRGDRVAWFFDREDDAKYLRDDEDRLENLVGHFIHLIKGIFASQIDHQIKISYFLFKFIWVFT